MRVMAKRKPPADEPKLTLFVRLDADTAAAMAAFIAAQPVPPERPAVTITALREFLSRHGFWPPAR